MIDFYTNVYLMSISLNDRFNLAMYDLYKKAKIEVKYSAIRYLHMLDANGGVETARILINSPTVSEGYSKLWELGRLDLTVEALIWDNQEYHILFTEIELQKVRNRLIEYGYKPALKK
jgi:hypothetical protein